MTNIFDGNLVLGVEGAPFSNVVCSLKKGELHAHLNGLVDNEVIYNILVEEGVELPVGFDPKSNLVHRSACTTLESYLAPWQFLRRIPARKENLQKMVDSAFEGLAANNVKFVELRSSVLYLATLQSCSANEALELLIECTQIAAEKYSVSRALIMTVTRGDYSSVQLSALISAYRALGRPAEVVGIDLAGNEEISYPVDLPGLFRAAKHDYGLGVTIHAGETGSADNVRIAAEQFDADRIGHGTAAGSDPWLMDFLSKEDICIEVCPVSNRLTGAVASSEMHPMQGFLKHGVPFVICSDNPGIHQKGLNDDYVMAMAEGMSFHEICLQYDVAKRYSFIKDIV
jgi:adenosine deaminase